MAAVSPTSPPTDSLSPGQQDPNPIQQSKPFPIDPFSFNISSWEEWTTVLCPPPLPHSSSLPTPPKINLFCTYHPSNLLIQAKEPLPFTPSPGPITLDSPASIPVAGPINLFDSKPLEQPAPSNDPIEPPQQVNTPQSTEEERIEGGISAPNVDDTTELEFDWPSEEIKRACEDLFPGNKEWMLPALNWIAPDENGGELGEMMQDIQ